MDNSLEVTYNGKIVGEEDSMQYWEVLQRYNDQRCRVKLHGCTYTSSPKICAYGDDETLSYAMSGVRVRAQPWTASLMKLKNVVESVCKTSFNYALLTFYSCGQDKTGAHKNSDIGLDFYAPIAIVSLGAIRMMHFTRKYKNLMQMVLENGSLLVVKASANKLWSRAIPPQPEVTEGTINITFLKLRPVCRKERVYNEKVLPPIKCSCVENAFQNIIEDNVLTNFSLSVVEGCSGGSKESEISSRANETVYKRNIGEDVFVVVSVFNGLLKVHICEYVINLKGEHYPKCDGISMDLRTWYELILKLSFFNLYYTSASFVVNNNILILNNGGKMHIQTFTCENKVHIKPDFIQLDREQMYSLRESVHDVNDKIINFLFTKSIPFFIESERRLLYSLSCDEDVVLYNQLVKAIECELVSIFHNIYYCIGCVNDYPTQSQHECLNLSNLEKYNLLGSKVLMLLDIQAVVIKFVNTVDFISESFLKKICVQSIKDILFTSCEK